MLDNLIISIANEPSRDGNQLLKTDNDVVIGNRWNKKDVWNVLLSKSKIFYSLSNNQN